MIKIVNQAERINELQWREYYERVEAEEKDRCQEQVNSRVEAWKKKVGIFELSENQLF